MNILDFLKSAEALKIVFQLGYMPEKDEFYELTPEQYEQYYKTEGQHDARDRKIFMLLPHDAKKYNEIASEEVFVVTEQEMSYFDNAGRIIESYCKNSDTPFDSFEDKLYYVAKLVPDVCVEGTKFEKPRLTVVRKS
jgi:hypothetical protein